MLKINKKVEYALMSLKYLHKGGEGFMVNAKTLSDKFHYTREIIAKVMQNLVNNEVVTSVQGAQGGYLLKRQLKDISFWELNNMILDNTDIASCLSVELGACEMSSHCNIMPPISFLNNKIIDLFRNITLLDLISHDVMEANIGSGLLEKLKQNSNA